MRKQSNKRREKDEKCDYLQHKHMTLVFQGKGLP